MISTPNRTEADPFYFAYIDRVSTDDIVSLLHAQIDKFLPAFKDISEERSLYRYSPDKWSIRQVLNHVVDIERNLLFRSMWFARGLDSPLPSFKQEVAASHSNADDCSWGNHIEEFQAYTDSITHLLFKSAFGRMG